jgi:hypothetical protein
MKWVFLAAGVLILLAGAMAAVGAMLARAHYATRKARYGVAPDALYAVLAGPPGWRSGVTRYGELPDEDGRKRWWEEDTHRRKIAYELVEAKPAGRLVTRIVQPGLPFGGTWTFEIAPVPGGGAELRIHEDGEIYNPIFRFMARFLFGYTGAIETYLRDLGAKLGEPVAIET